MKHPFYRPAALNTTRLVQYLEEINERRWYTNNGPLVRQLTEKLEEYLGVKNLLLVSSGTVALQVAYKALHRKGRIYTTPLSFIASSSAFGWLGSEIHYADIDNQTLNLDPGSVRKYSDITSDDTIVATHLYGNPCDIKAFENLKNETHCKIIYDASHAFATRFQGKNILSLGDASTVSFHATKLFHTIEGGGVVFANADDLARAQKMINFGFNKKNEIEEIGINAKMSELHAAVGLVVLEELDSIIEKRCAIADQYRSILDQTDITTTVIQEGTDICSPSYMPIVLASAKERELLQASMLNDGIETRNYFDSLQSTTELFEGSHKVLPNSQRFNKRVLCLPLYPELTPADITYICDRLRFNLEAIRSEEQVCCTQ